MVKNSRERITSSTPTLQKEGGEADRRPIQKYLSGNARLNIWPEWDDASLANEKWDVPQKGKSDRAARTPGTLFEDPEGLVQLPGSLKADAWRRPSDYLGEKRSATLPNTRRISHVKMSSITVGSMVPQSARATATPNHLNKLAQTVVEDPEQTGRLKILLPNQKLFRKSELVRNIITQISLLHQTEAPSPVGLRTDGNVAGGDTWKPWHHLYPRSKPPNSFPVHSASGKYAVKLFWMGAWRKIVVDDQIPFDTSGIALLPLCENECELWLPILAKAIIKVASLDFANGYPDSEIKEVSIIQMLTGWMPEVIYIKDRGDEDIWNLINSSIPAWTAEQPPSDSTSEHSAAQSITSQTAATNPTVNKPSLIFGSYDLAFQGEHPIGVPEIRAEVGGTSFSGLPPPMIWLTETRRAAIPPPKPASFTVIPESGSELRPTEALFQLRQQRQQRIKHDLLLKDLAATTPRLIHATSAFPNFEEVCGDYVPDLSVCQPKSSTKKREPEKKAEKKKEKDKDLKKKEGGDKEKGEKKKEDKLKKGSDDKSEKADKKTKEKKKTPDNAPQDIPADEAMPENEAEQEEEIAPVSPLISFWIQFGQFFRSFTKLYVFHKSNSYSCHRSVADMRNISPSCMVAPSGGRRTAGGQTLGSATHLKGVPAPSPIPASGNIPQHNHSILQGQPGEIQPSIILCIDSTEPIDMLISLTSLSNWHDAPVILNPTLGPVFARNNKLGYTPTEVAEINANPENEQMLVVPGRLELSNYLWNSITDPLDCIMRLETACTRTCRLTLPAGLHTLRLSVDAPYAWHTDFISNTPFVIADTESFVSHVNKESLRYQAAALRLMKVTSDCVENFGDPDVLAKTVSEIACADRDRQKDKIFPDIKVFFESLFHMLTTTVGEGLTVQHREAWATFATTFIRAYRQGSGQSTLGIFENDPVPFRKPSIDSEEITEQTQEGNKEEGSDAVEAATTIQKHFRGHHVRKRTRAAKKGTKVNLSTKESLRDSWGKLDGDELTHGLNIMSRLFSESPQLMNEFSFQDDTAKSAYFIDYHGSHNDVPARNWFLMFKEVFAVPEEALIAVSVTAGISGLLLRIIDNDTGEQVPTVANKPKPYTYKPNKAGYTIMCEGRTVDGPLTAGKYRLRLVGTTQQLMLPNRDMSSSGLETHDVREYYTPERNNLMFRYTVNVTADTPATVQISTSKADVNFRVEVFDGEETLHREEGIGHVVIPCLTFRADEDVGTGSAKGRRTPVKTRAKSGSKSPGRSKVSPVVPEPEPSPPGRKSHHYIVQTTVLRSSWDNNDSPWQPLLDQIQPRDSDLERPMSGSVAAEEKPSTPNKKRGAKEEKSDPKKSIKPGGKAASPAFDETKPFWILRVCSDTGDDQVILKRDTHREDEIKSIKTAWEELQPGRAAKAKALRENYLSRKAEEKSKAETEALATAVTDDVFVEGKREADSLPKLPASLLPESEAIVKKTETRPPSPVSKFYQIPAAFQPFVKGTDEDPSLFDDAEHTRLLDLHKGKVDEFHEGRREVLSARKEDRNKRNLMKEQLLATAETMQVEVDGKREDVMSLRDSLRQKQLAEEAARLAAIEPDHVTTPSPKPQSAKKPKSPKAAKKKK